MSYARFNRWGLGQVMEEGTDSEREEVEASEMKEDRSRASVFIEIFSSFYCRRLEQANSPNR